MLFTFYLELSKAVFGRKIMCFLTQNDSQFKKKYTLKTFSLNLTKMELNINQAKYLIYNLTKSG